MKVVTCSGGINFGKVKLDSEIFCENGHWSYGGKPLADHAAYGMLTVAQIIEKSSNIGAAKIAISMGEDVFHGWLRKYGFGQMTGIALPGESIGKLRKLKNWGTTSLASVAMGQEVSVTTVQLAQAASVIANGGLLVRPRLVSRKGDHAAPIVPPVRRGGSRNSRYAKRPS